MLPETQHRHNFISVVDGWGECVECGYSICYHRKVVLEHEFNTGYCEGCGEERHICDWTG